MAGRLWDRRIKSEGKEANKVLPCPFLLFYFILFLLYLKVWRSIGKLDFFSLPYYCNFYRFFFSPPLTFKNIFSLQFFSGIFPPLLFWGNLLLLLLQFKVLRKMFFSLHYLKSFIAFVREVVHKNRILRAHKQ